MGCGGSKDDALNRPGGGKLVIFGDYFSPETRTIITMLKAAGVPHEVQLVDQFKGEHKKDAYLQINPTGSIPTIAEGRYLVLGNYTIFLTYLCNNHKRVKDKLYPAENKNEIDKHLQWFQSLMRVSTGRIIKMIVGPQAFGEKAPPPEDMRRSEDEFFKKILPKLNEVLKNKSYMCGDEMTIVDLQYYNEIVTITLLTKKELAADEFPNLAPWFQRMSKVPETMDTDKRLKEVVTKYNFHS